MVHTPKRKFIDDNGKIVGSIKFKCEKAKNLSTPNNNNFGRKVIRKIIKHNLAINFSNVSVLLKKLACLHYNKT